MAEAKLLLRVHQAFAQVVSSLVSGQLIDVPRGTLSKSWIDNCTLAGHVSAEQDSVVITRRLTLSPHQLASTLHLILGARALDEKDLFREYGESLVRLYLSKSDCLVINEPNDPNDGAIDVRIEYIKSDVTPTLPRIRACRNPDFLSFTKIDYRPREGQPLVIVPHYRCGSYSKTAIGSASTQYSLETSVPWLHWDDRIMGWRGSVPLYSESLDGGPGGMGNVYGGRRLGPYAIIHILRIEVKAIRTERVKGISVERTIRSRLTLKVLPFWSKGFTPSPQVGSMKRMANKQNLNSVCNGSSRVVSRDARFPDPNEPSIYVSPKPSIKVPPELEWGQPGTATLSKGQQIKSQQDWTKEWHDHEQAVMHKAKHPFNPFETPSTAVASGSNRFGLPTHPSTELNVYPASGLGNFSQRMCSIRSGFGVRHSTPFTVPHSSGRSLKRPRKDSAAEELQGSLHDLRDSMVRARFTLRSQAERSHTSPTPARTHMTPIERRSTDKASYEVTVHSQAPTESGSVFDQEQILHPVSAEVFALAQTLHSQSIQDRSARKRSRAASFEDSPGKKVREDRPQTPKDLATLSVPQSSPCIVPVTPSNISGDGNQQLLSPSTTNASEAQFDGYDDRRDSVRDSSDNSGSAMSIRSRASSPLDIEQDTYVDPTIRREQELLRRALTERGYDADEARPSVDERKELFQAMKQSMAMEERRQNTKLGIHESADFSMSEAMSGSDQDTNSEDAGYSSFDSKPASGMVRTRIIRSDNSNAVQSRLFAKRYEDATTELSSTDIKTFIGTRRRMADYITESPSSLSSTEHLSSDQEMETQHGGSEDEGFRGLSSFPRSDTPAPSASRAAAAAQALPSSAASPRVAVQPGQSALADLFASRARARERSLSPLAEERLGEERGRPRERALMGLFGSVSRASRQRTSPLFGGRDGRVE